MKASTYTAKLLEPTLGKQRRGNSFNLPPLGRYLRCRGIGVTTVSFYVGNPKPTSPCVDSRCVAAVVGLTMIVMYLFVMRSL